MAYPITAEALDLFTNSYRQVVEISFNGVNENIKLTEQDISLGGFSVNRYCVSGNKIEIGSAIAAELALSLDNSDGRFDEVFFEGAELYVRVGSKKWEARRWEHADYHYIPFGYFTIDEAPRKLAKITLSALDRMVMFDKAVDLAMLTFPISVSDLLYRICDICNITLGIDALTLTNADYIVNEAPIGDDLTYRQILSWIAEITGTCAFIDWNGHLILKWYEDTDIEITTKDRYSSDLQENSVAISGVQIKDGDTIHLVGDDAYAINIESNSLIQHDHRAVAETLYTKLNGFTYTPFTATVKPMPHLYPLDKVSFVDKVGVAHPTIITDFTFTLNTSTSIGGKGETATKSGYASANPLTKAEAAIINAIKVEQNKVLNDRVQSVLALNELISNALGLFITPVEQENGSTIYYMHNQPNLEESQNIFTMTAEGIAWTASGWNNGEPVWSYGTTAAGDALFRMLSAEGIEVGKVGEDYNIEMTPRAFRIFYREMLVTEIEADEMTIPKAIFTTHAECGKIRLVPHTENGVVTGTNMVFVD